MKTTDRYYNSLSPRFWFGPIDLRPVGFMRIVFGAVLFWSTIDLAPVLHAFFSDEGVAPRAAYLGSMVRATRICIYDIAGPDWVLYALYGATLLSIVALTVGWRSKLASVVTFVLVSGLHERNLVVYDSSDNVLRVTLFWMMFMPIGARYSIDAVLRSARGLPVVTHATALPIRMGQLQIAWIYTCTMLYKWPGVPWHDGSALRVALGLDHLFTRSLGAWVFHQRWLVEPGTRATVVVELIFPILAFLPIWRPRTGPLARLPDWLFQPAWKGWGIGLVTALHVGIATMMSIGNFSYIMIATYFLLYEPEWIETIVDFVQRSRLWRAVCAEARGLFHDHLSALAAAPPPPTVPQVFAKLIPPWVRKTAPRVLHVVILPGLMVLGVWLSLPDETKIPSLVVRGRTVTPVLDISPGRMWRPLVQVVEEIELWQRWNMFSPYPLDHDVYFMGRGFLADGTAVDVLRGKRGNGGSLVPPIDRGFFFTRWTKYISNILFEPKDSPQVLEFGRWVCREWNTDAPSGRAALSTFKLFRMEHRIALFGERDPDGWHEVEIWDHKCF